MKNLLSVLSLLAVFSIPRPGYGQDSPHADSSSPAPRDIRASAYLGTDLVGLYSTTYGIGVDGIIGFRNVPLPGSSLRLHVWPSRFRRAVFGNLSLTDPTASPLIFTGHVLGEWNRKDRIYNAVDADRNDWLQFDRNSQVFELKVGYQHLQTGLVLLPYVRYEWHHIFNGAYAPKSSAQRSSGSGSIARDPTFSGLVSGINLLFDRTNRLIDPSRGFAVQIRYERMDVKSSEIECHGICTEECRVFECPADFDRVDLGMYGYVSPWPDHVIAMRILASELTEDARWAPYYLKQAVDHRYLPGYTRNRFSADRFVVASLEYRMPLGRIFDLYSIKFLVHAGVAGLEDYAGDRYLHPGFALGIRVASLANKRILINWRIGVSPEGVTVVPFRSVFMPDPRISYPTFR
jgi:hypothetical protein